MEIREIVATYLMPVLALLGWLLARQAARALLPRVDRLLTSVEGPAKARAHLLLLESIGRYAEAAVAEVEATFVRDLKDPSKPGSWTEVAAAEAKTLAVAKVRALAPELVTQLARPDSAVDQLIGTLVEWAVSRRMSKPTPPVSLPRAGA